MRPEVPIEGHAGLVKDVESGAVLSKDRTALEARRRERERVRRIDTDHQLLHELQARVTYLEGIIRSLGVIQNG